MIRLLPFILIPILILGGLGYWRYSASKNNLEAPQNNEFQQEEQAQETPLEVPKTLPEATTEEKVKALEESVDKLVAEINKLKSTGTKSSSSESQINLMEASVIELKARVSSLEQATPAPVAASQQAAVYIPLGAGGGPWADKDWYSVSEYEISINTDNYPNYTGISLEVIFKLAQASGTGSVRLYNVTDSVGYSQVDTTSTNYSLKTSSSFKIASGTKTYKLQVKSSDGKDLYIQSARLKVSF